MPEILAALVRLVAKLLPVKVRSAGQLPPPPPPAIRLAPPPLPREARPEIVPPKKP